MAILIKSRYSVFLVLRETVDPKTLKRKTEKLFSVPVSAAAIPAELLAPLPAPEAEEIIARFAARKRCWVVDAVTRNITRTRKKMQEIKETLAAHPDIEISGPLLSGTATDAKSFITAILAADQRCKSTRASEQRF